MGVGVGSSTGVFSGVERCCEGVAEAGVERSGSRRVAPQRGEENRAGHVLRCGGVGPAAGEEEAARKGGGRSEDGAVGVASLRGGAGFKASPRGVRGVTNKRHGGACRQGFSVWPECMAAVAVPIKSGVRRPQKYALVLNMQNSGVLNCTHHAA